MLLRYIRYFLAVAEHENFTRAAEALSISQPTLSQQIRQLEELVGTTLFERSARKITLTDAGELWSAYARRVMLEVDDGMRAIKDAADLSVGRLTVAFTPTFSAWLLAPLVQTFHQRWPGVTISVSEMDHAAIERQLMTHQLDLGVAFGPHNHPEVKATPIFQEQLELMVGPGHPLHGQQTPLTPAQASQLSFILPNEGFATRQHVNDYFCQHQLAPDVAIETNSMSTVEALILGQPMATILPAPVAVRCPELHVVPLSPAIPLREVVVLERREGWRSAASQAFRQMLEEFTVNLHTDGDALNARVHHAAQSDI